MTLITKSLSGFIYNGPALALASAAFKSKVRVIYGFNAGGSGYTAFKPTSNFNSLAQLVQDGVYIVDAVTTGFDIPGATLTAIASAPASAPSLRLDNFSVSNKRPLTGSATNLSFDLTFELNSSDVIDEHTDIIILSSDPQLLFLDGFGTFSPNSGSPISVSGIGIMGTIQKVMAVSNAGNIVVKEFLL